MSQLIVIAVACCLSNLSLVSPDPRSLIVPAEQQARAKQLVEQLGHVIYRDRARATRELRAMGRLALIGLEIGKMSDNPEVRHRIKLILPAARRADFEARLNVFLADKTGMYNHQLPGWDEFQAIVGGSQAGREFFIKMLKSPPNRKLIQAIAINPNELAQRIYVRQSDLWAAKLSTNLSRWGSWPCLYSDSDRCDRLDVRRDRRR